MKIGEMFGGNYLKAADLQGKKIKVIIEEITFERLADDEKEKPILRFKGKDKALVLNVTNAHSLADITGSDDSDDWVGKTILLYSTKVDFQGKRVDAIRIADPNPKPVVAEEGDEPPF